MTDEKRCTKCGQEPRVKGNVWGKACRAAYEKARRAKDKGVRESERAAVALVQAQGITGPLGAREQVTQDREVIALRATVADLEQRLAEAEFEAGLRRR